MDQAPDPPRSFRLLLRLYPRRFRDRYGDEMAAVFCREREVAGGGAVFWVRQILDHLEASWAVRARRRRREGAYMKTLGYDLRLALRSLVRAPAFTVFAVLTLALGVGSTAAVFTVVDRVLLRPLSYPGSERMALVGIEARSSPGSVGPLSPALLTSLEERPGPAESVVAARTREAILGGGDPERIEVTEVSGDFFDFFGARSTAGRLLRSEDQEPGSPPVAVLGHAFWQERFGGDPGVVGRGIRLNDRVHTVVGVLSPEFQPPEHVVEEDDIWLPLEVDRTVTSSFFLAGVARLRAGQGLESLDAHADAVLADVHAETGMPRFLLGAAVEPYRDAVVGPVAGALGRVMAGVSLLLLIACVNVAGLLLTRGAERGQELGVHVALGASRGRLLRKLLGESALLALAGGLAGSVLAWVAVELFRAHAPAGLPRLGEVALDARGLAFALGLSGATVVLFGLLPALRSTRDVDGRWRRGARNATAGRSEGRFRAGLIATETALAVVMAVGAGLLAHDLARVASEDSGFRPEGLVAMTLNLEPRYEREEWPAMWERLMEEAAASPGARSVAVATQAPYGGTRMASMYRPEGSEGEEATFVITVAVGGDYREALGARLLEGRPLTPGDAGDRESALVNQAFVERYWPGSSGVGRVVRSGEEDEPDYRVVGVLADVRTHPGQDVTPHVYLPLREAAWREMELLVRTEGDAAALASGLREAVRRVDPALAVTRIQTLEALTARALATPRFYTALFAGFAIMAVLLALVGVYGTTAFATRARFREIGIRQALGAQRRQVVGSLVARTGGMVALGLVVGLAAAALVSGLLSDTLRYVDPRDGMTYVVVALAVLGVGMIAAWIPARAAGRVDPAMTLREE